MSISFVTVGASKLSTAARAILSRLAARLCAAIGPHADRRQIDALITRSIGDAGAHFDPADATQLHLFVHGPLSATLEELLGASVSEGVMSRLSLAGLAPQPSALLVVCDEYRLRERLEDLLSAHGYPVTAVGTTAEALSACRHALPTLVLCDADARDGFGVSAADRLEEMLDPCPPIVVLVDRDAAQSGGHLPMLSKTLDPMAVLTMVSAMVGDGAPPGPGPGARSAEPPLGRALPPDALHSTLAPLITEALELVAAPEVRGELLRDALRRAEINRIPDDLRAFAAFVSGALYLAIRDRFGEDAADAVLEDLRTTSGIHQRALLELSDADDTPSGVRGPMVRKIVLADDDEQLLSVLSRALREAGYEVMTAANGRDALSLSLRNEPDVLVCDMHIPVLSGRDVCQLLHRMRGSNAPAAVLVTADSTVPRELDDIASVLAKPVKVADLIRAIEAAAQQKLANVL